MDAPLPLGMGRLRLEEKNEGKKVGESQVSEGWRTKDIKREREREGKSRMMIERIKQ